MVKLDEGNSSFAGPVDAEVTLEQVPGFKLEVPAGSVTFPDGSTEGYVSVTAVNASKVPMVPPNGSQPQFVVTIQPAGAIFDPPAPMTVPNFDAHLPGAQVEMFSFDHDLEEFVAIGLGTVTEDGTLIRSNPGVGVIKAGWHGSGPPQGQGCPHNCPVCQDCDANCECVPIDQDPRLDGIECVTCFNGRPKFNPDGTLSEQDLNDCVTSFCGYAQPNDAETPNVPDKIGDCRAPICSGGSPSLVAAAEELPASSCQMCDAGSVVSDPGKNGNLCGDGLRCLDGRCVISCGTRDTDGDGINDCKDPDLDGDGQDNPDDLDDDGDGIPDTEDMAPNDPNEHLDSDKDRIPDRDDTDLDGDGLANDDDPHPLDPKNKAPKAELAEADNNGSAETEQESPRNADTMGDPVIARTGELIIEETDLRIPGRGIDFAFTRTYRSRFNFDGPIGHNWDHNYNERLILTELNGDILRQTGGGRSDRYRNIGNGRYRAPAGYYDEINSNPDGTYTLRDRYGYKRHFGGAGRLIGHEDRNGNSLSFGYDEDGQLTLIVDTLGREIILAYGDDARIESVTDFSGRQVRYTYDEMGDLRAVRSPIVENTSTGNDFLNGKVTRYTYSTGFDSTSNPALAYANHNLLTVTDPKGQTYLSNIYENDPSSYEFDKVIQQQFGVEEQLLTFSYIEMNPDAEINPELQRNRTVVVDRNGNRRELVHNEDGNLVEEWEFTNRNVNSADPDRFGTMHRYNTNGERTRTLFPEGNSIEYTFDDTNPDPLQQGNLLRVRQLAGPRAGDQNLLISTFRYEPIYNQQRSITDPRGNSNYDPPNGGAGGSARYTSTRTFDYQESSNLTALAQETGRSQAEIQDLLLNEGVAINLGDINQDGLTDQIAGNVVRTTQPSVLLADGGVQDIVSLVAYNRFGQRTALTDPEGNVDEYEYHPEIDPDGDGINTSSPLALATDTGGYLKAEIVDARHVGSNPIAPTAIRTELEYDLVGNVVSSRDGRGNETLYEVNQLNQVVVISKEAPFFYQTRVFYDANDNVEREEVENRDSIGPFIGEFVTTSYEYDILDNRILMQQQVSSTEFLTTRYVYDYNDNLNQVIQPDGNSVYRVFDERDQVFSITRGAGSEEASRSTYTYDGNGNLIFAVDAADNDGDGQNEITQKFYDGFDWEISGTDAVGNEMRYHYDPAGNKVRELHFGPIDGTPGSNNVLLARIEMDHDELNRAYQRRDYLSDDGIAADPDGGVGDDIVFTNFVFDALNRQVRVIDDNEHQIEYVFDGADRMVRQIDELNNVIRYTYDNNNNLEETLEIERSPGLLVPDESFLTTAMYDSLDRLQSITDNLGNVSTYRYDSRDNLIEEIDPLGNAVLRAYDGLNRLVQEDQELQEGGVGSGFLDTSNPGNPDGVISTIYDWDNNSRLLAQTDDRGNRTRYGYDDLNRRVTEFYADGTVLSRVFDQDDNLVRVTDQNGSVQNIVYDGINRMVRRELIPAGDIEGSTLQTFQYDGLSRQTRATDNNDPADLFDDSTVEFEYDTLSRMVAEVQNGKRITSRYDGVDNRVALHYPNGRQLNRRFDGLDRTDQITEGVNKDLVAQYAYLGPQRVLERQFGNGTSLQFHSGGQQVGYDGLKRAVNLQHKRISDNALLAGFDYRYDKAGNRRYELDTVSSLADTYQYDSAYRLSEVSFEVAAGDVSGIQNNETTNEDVTDLIGSSNTHYLMDGVSNWLDVDTEGAVVSYDSNEMNEYSLIDGALQDHDDNGNLANDGNRQYIYDTLNRLIQIRDGSGSEISRYSYDSLNRRIRKETQGESLLFFYDGNQVIEERGNSDQVLRQYVYGLNIDDVLQMRSGAQDFYYHENSLGSTTALSDGAGDVIERYDYDAYGLTRVLAADGLTELIGSSVSNPYLYTGRRLDEESGLYFYRARYYSPARGRFLQRDPLGYADGMGLYAYVQNNPVNFIDPMGLEKNGNDGDEFAEIPDSAPDQLIDGWELWELLGAFVDMFGLAEGSQELAMRALEQSRWSTFASNMDPGLLAGAQKWGDRFYWSGLVISTISGANAANAGDFHGVQDAAANIAANTIAWAGLPTGSAFGVAVSPAAASGLGWVAGGSYLGTRIVLDHTAAGQRFVHTVGGGLYDWGQFAGGLAHDAVSGARSARDRVVHSAGEGLYNWSQNAGGALNGAHSTLQPGARRIISTTPRCLFGAVNCY